jgi:acyl-CoA thioesterase-1
MRRIIAGLAITALIGCRGVAPAAKSEAGSSAPASAPEASQPATARAPVRNIVFLGTSLTAGLGVGDELAFPAVIQQKIDAEKLPFHVTNAGISGETSAGGLRRIDWLLQTPVDVMVVELGANDGLRALNVDSMQHNIDAVLQHTRARYPNAALVVVGMEAPPNLGQPYTSHFHDVYPALAKKYNAALVPFLLQGVAGDRALNQEDGMHPNPQGHRIVADNVWRVLKPVLVSRAKAPS